MKKGSILFLQAVIMCIGFGALTLLLWEPHLEGRNVNATVFEVYFHDPFLAYVYGASIAFFVALYQVFKWLGLVRRNEVSSNATLQVLRTIRYCALVLIIFMVGAELYFFLFQRGKEDIAGGVMMGLVMIVVSVVVAAATIVFEGLVDRKSEQAVKTSHIF